MEELENSFFEKPPEKEETKSEISFEDFCENFGTELSPEEAVQMSKLVPKEKILFEFSQKHLTGGKVVN